MDTPKPVLTLFGDRRHELIGRNCSGPHFCKHCNQEMTMLYDAPETKARIRAVLEEHLGPDAANIGDMDDLRGRGDTLEWTNVAIALETEFGGIRLHDLALSRCGTIDQIARLIDVIVASRNASPH